MNKTQLVEKIAEKAGITKKAADDALKAFEAVVIETLAEGGDVSLVLVVLKFANARNAKVVIQRLMKSLRLRLAEYLSSVQARA